MIEILKAIGVLQWLNKGLSPLFRLAGIEPEAVPFSAVGLLLGISYGAGLLLQEARSASVQPRQVFLACVFMGFAHAIVEDTLIAISLGADITTLLFGRLAFAVVATAIIAQTANVALQARASS